MHKNQTQIDFRDLGGKTEVTVTTSGNLPEVDRTGFSVLAPAFLGQHGGRTCNHCQQPDRNVYRQHRQESRRFRRNFETSDLDGYLVP